MSNPNNPKSRLNRRTLLKNIGVGAVATITTSSTVSASSAKPWDQTVEKRTFEADINDNPEVVTAEITIHESGSVNKNLEIDTDAISKGSGSNQTYSLNLKTKSDRIGAQSIQPNNITPEDLTAKVTKIKKPDGQVSTSGLDEPSVGGYDTIYYGETKSQECGPLARTTVQDSGYGWSHDRDHVDGDACDGETWDQKFKDFCIIQKQFTGNCNVPDVFDTDWNNKYDYNDNDAAGTIWSCPNFPAVSGTVVTAHDVEANGSSVEFNASFSIAQGINWDKYDPDQNGIANAAFDLANLLSGGVIAPFSWALAKWLLDYNSGVKES